MPKVASTSMGHALNGKGKFCEPIFSFIRHPWERLYSALMMLDPDMGVPEAYQKHRDNFHLRPQSEQLAPFIGRIEFLGHYDRLNEDWQWVVDNVGAAPLGHMNKGPGGDWREVDWPDVDRYKDDFELCAKIL